MLRSPAPGSVAEGREVRHAERSTESPLRMHVLTSVHTCMHVPLYT